MGVKKTYISGVYVITNTVTNMFYIGSSNCIRSRLIGHRANLRNGKHCNKHLQAAYNKYGDEAFEWNVMELCEPEERLSVEQSYLDRYWDYDILYNMNPSTTVNKHLHTPAVHKKSADTRKRRGRKHTEESIALMRAKRLERDFTPEQKAAISAKISAAKKGKKRTEEAKAISMEIRRANKELKRKELENGSHT